MKRKASPVVTIVLSILISVSLVLLFVPYYAQDGGGVSLASYTWFPTDHAELTKSIGSAVEGHTVSDILVCTIFVPFGGLACLFLLWKFRDTLLSSALTGAWGLWALVWYAKNPALRLGGGIWTTFLLLFAAAGILSVIHAITLWNDKKGEVGTKPAADQNKRPVSSF